MMRSPTNPYHDPISNRHLQNGSILQQKTDDSPPESTFPQDTPVEMKLRAAKKAAQEGQHQRAYRLSWEATQMAPERAETWLYRAAYAGTNEERLSSLSRALSLDPEQSTARYGMYETLKSYLNEEASLRYIEETKSLYRVLTSADFAVLVPKDRTIVAPYPSAEPTPLRPVYRWLIVSTLGLLLGGLGTLFSAPVAVLLAWRGRRQPATPKQHRRARMALLYAGTLWIIGLLVSVLFLIHL